MTAPAGSGQPDPRRILLVAPPPRLVAEATEAGFDVLTLADPDGFQDDDALRRHLAELVRTHRVSKLIACGEASALPAVLETAERLGLSPNRAAVASLLADPAGIRGLLTRSGPQWEAVALPARTGEQPPAYDVEYGVETLTAEGMHRVTGIVELRRADTGGAEEGPAAPGGRGSALHTFPAPLTGQEEAEIRALATGLLDLAGYEFGYAFTRIAHTAEGPRIINAYTRQASRPVSRLIELTTGLASERELVRALSGKPMEAAVLVGCAAAVPLPCPDDVPQDVTLLAGVRELRDGYVLVTALTPAELTARTAAVRDRLA
ncbi:hypothetical protein [Streptomyces sp. NPDC086010]|uniref:hypothetical protein n=1 Tax=Streptomyces sp. NPDC086010 TaxID=3365745 RepID=UPI0037D85A54